MLPQIHRNGRGQGISWAALENATAEDRPLDDLGRVCFCPWGMGEPFLMLTRKMMRNWLILKIAETHV